MRSNMTPDEFDKRLDEYRHAKYDIVENFDTELYDCFEDLVSLKDDTLEHFDYYWYDDEWTACSDLKDNACYIINVPGYIVKRWFEGKKEEAKEALKKAQKTNDRFRLKRQ